MAENNQRLLIVDDEKDIVQAYVDFLSPEEITVKRSSRSANKVSSSKTQNYQIFKAHSGAEAIAIFKSQFEKGERIAGGFFDVKMEGGIDGLQTIQELWKIDPDLHCTVVTAYHDRDVDDMDALFGERFKDQWDYLNKPFTQAEIIQKARQMIAAWNRKRNLEQTREQLIRSERMAAIGQVARAIGHEFGNILQAILGKADLALTEKDPAKLKDKLTTILQAAERGSLIVKNLRSFSKTTPEKKELLPSLAIEQTIGLLGHEMKKSSVEWIDRRSTTGTVFSNAGEIEQILLNLMINAIHAMPSGGKLEVGCSETSTQVQIWVKDTGTGISPDVLPNIFEYAFTTKGDKGSGLGLSISKEIAEKHNGSLSVQTALGQGTTFTLVIPKGDVS